MRLSATLLSLAATLAVGSSYGDNAFETVRLKKEFMAAMNQRPELKAGRRAGKSQKLRKLQEDLKKEVSRKLQNYQQVQQTYSQGQSSSSQSQSSGQKQYSNNWYGNSGQYGQQQSSSSTESSSTGQGYKNFLADQDGNIYFQGSDGYYYNAYGGQVQPNEYGLYPWEYDAIPYDLAARSFKYAGCAAIKTYDEDAAYYNGNAMTLNTYAVFRLCPANKCNQYSLTGCSKDYGEYTVDVKTYLAYLLSYYDDEYTNFCDYCQPCDYDEQQLLKEYLYECHLEQNEVDFEYYQQIQQQAYYDFLNANGGKDASSSTFHFYGQSPYNSGQGFNAWNGLYYDGAASNNGVNNPSSSYSHYDYQANVDNVNSQYNYSSGYSYSQNAAARNSQNSYKYGNGNGRHLNAEERRLSAQSECKKFVKQMQSTYSNAQTYDYYSSFVQSGGGQDYYDENSNFYDEEGNFNANGYMSYLNVYTGASDAGMADYWNLMDCCEDGTVCDPCQIQAEKKFGDCDGYICHDYYTYCDSNYYANDDGVDLVDFLECSAVETDGGAVFYVAPHCGSDHYTISLGIFSDEYCLDYVGESMSLTDLAGFQYHDSDLFQFPQECVSCDGAGGYAGNRNSGEGQYGQYYQAPTSDSTESVLSMCSSLYSLSAQCNKRMSNFEQVARLMTQAELAEEDRACTFIDNIMAETYDENGDISLRDDFFNFNDWRNPQKYHRLRLPTSQALSLSFSIILCVALGAVAFAYKTALSKNLEEHPWLPKRLSEKSHTFIPRVVKSLASPRRPSMGDQKPASSSTPKDEYASAYSFGERLYSGIIDARLGATMVTPRAEPDPSAEEVDPVILARGTSASRPAGVTSTLSADPEGDYRPLEDDI